MTMNDKIVIQGARENNLKNVNLTIPRDKLVVFTGSAAPESPASRSIPFMPKGSDAMWKVSVPTPASFWGRWTSRM